MAYSTVANVKKATADNDVIPGPHHYRMVRAVNGANANNVITLRKGDASGAIIWQSASLAANASDDSNAEIHLAGGDIWVDMSQAGGTVFLYSC